VVECQNLPVKGNHISASLAPRDRWIESVKLLLFPTQAIRAVIAIKASLAHEVPWKSFSAQGLAHQRLSRFRSVCCSVGTPRLTSKERHSTGGLRCSKQSTDDFRETKVPDCVIDRTELGSFTRRMASQFYNAAQFKEAFDQCALIPGHQTLASEVGRGVGRDPDGCLLLSNYPRKA
jgi:hypothetical protein